MTNDNKHSCNLNWCEQHGECFYKNEDNAYVEEKVCYHDDWVGSIHKEKVKPTVIKRVEDSDDSWNLTLALRKNKIRKDKEPKIKDGKVIRCSNIYCGTTEEVTAHHLTPNPYRKRIEGAGKTIPLCWKCHQRVHWLRTNKELAHEYNTKEAVLKLLATDITFRVQRLINVVDKDVSMVA